MNGWTCVEIPRWLWIVWEWDRLEDEARGLFPAAG